MSEFQQTLYSIVQKIPSGTVASYGQLALLAGKPRAARLVGTLMKNCPKDVDIPCHRVVKSDGSLCDANCLWSLVQQETLRAEGVPFLADGRVDIARCRWGGPER